MFGYVKPVVSELLVKENEFYRATYCGICRAMKKYTGNLSRTMLTYDSVFLALVRMAYIPDSELGSSLHRCVLHPVKKKNMLDDNSALEYTARAFGILTYYKMRDDLSDEGLGKRMLVSFARPVASRAKKLSDLTPLADFVGEKLDAITALERENTASIDIPAALFGDLLGEVFAYGLTGSDAIVTRQVGIHLGKFIYAADAAEDYAEDVKNGRYNPYAQIYGRDGLTPENKRSIKNALIMECRDLEAAINLIPFEKKITVENIVRNIIYLGLVKRIEFLDREEEKK